MSKPGAKSLFALAGVVLAGLGAVWFAAGRPFPQDHPKPGSRAAMETAMSQVVTLTRQNFAAQTGSAKPVLIDFWAPWCGPCRAQGPIVEEVAARAGDTAVVAKVNVDEEPVLAQQFGIEAIPTLVVLKGGRPVQRLMGVHSAADLGAALANAQ